MCRHLMRTYRGIASAGAAVALAALGISTATAAVTAAPPSLGRPSYNQGWAGYTAGGGRWFRYVSTTVTIPPRTIHGARVGAAFIALQHTRPTGLPEAMMSASPGGGAGSVTYLADPWGVLAISPHIGDRLTLSIFYDQHGHDYFTATDITRRTSQTVRVNVSAVVYDLARLGARPAGSTAPPAEMRRRQFGASHVTTYSGDHGTILGPWTTSKVSMTSTGTASGTVVASPSPLRDNGRSFGVWLRAAGDLYQRICRLRGQRRPVPVRVHDPGRAGTAGARRGGTGHPRVQRRANPPALRQHRGTRRRGCRQHQLPGQYRIGIVHVRNVRGPAGTRRPADGQHL